MFHLIRSYRWYVLLAMIVGLGLALLLFTPLKHIADFGTESAAVTPSEIQNFAGLTLPASTRNLQVHYSAFQDQLLYTRFDLPSSDLPAFVASVAWGELPASVAELPPGFSHDNRYLTSNWWHPQTATQMQTGSWSHVASSGNHTHSQLLFDQSDPLMTIIYVVTINPS